MTYTTNYNLHKPDTTDNFNISDFNANSDIIDKQFGITSANIPKVTCSTAASTVAKTATINGTFVLNRGARVLVVLSTANTVASATFNLNSTGAKSILVNGASVTASNLTAQTYLAEYDGTNWRFITSIYTSDYARYSNSAASATSAGKLTTARKTYVTLGTASTTTTRDWSGDTTIPVNGTLNIVNGGTGATTDKAAQNNLLGSMNQVTDDLTDNTQFVFKYVTPSNNNGALYNCTAQYPVKYFNNRISGRPNLTCSTAGATAAKTVDLAGFVLSKGAQLIITFSNANTVATPTLNVNSTGVKEIRINRTTVSTDSSSGNYLKASTAYYAHYDGSYWQLDTYQVPLARYAASTASAIDCSYPESKFEAYCDTAAATVAKVGRCRGFAIYTGCVLSLRVTVANTATSPTLNVQSSGAKTIYINGSAVTSSNQLSVGLYIAYYDGTYWQLIRTVTDSTKRLTVDAFHSPDVAFSYTPAATTAKVAVMPSFKLVAGTRFRFYLINSNTVANATLNVNGTGALSMSLNGAAITANNLTSGWYDIVYNGTGYLLNSVLQPDWTQTDNTKADFIKNKIPIWITSGTAVDSTATILLNMVYPVGSVYMSVNNVSPQSFLGGTWQAITDGRFVRASGSNAASVPTIAQIKAGTGIQAEGLPNITGSIASSNSTYGIGSNNGSTNVGALSGSGFNKKTSAGTSSSSSYMNKIEFDASLGNSTVPDGASSGKIYGNSNHVTPKNMSVYMWVRTA